MSFDDQANAQRLGPVQSAKDPSELPRTLAAAQAVWGKHPDDFILAMRAFADTLNAHPDQAVRCNYIAAEIWKALAAAGYDAPSPMATTAERVQHTGPIPNESTLAVAPLPECGTCGDAGWIVDYTGRVVGPCTECDRGKANQQQMEKS